MVPADDSGEAPGYWHQVTAVAEPAPALHGAAETDVVIIGAGYTGLSTALHCREAGLQACVLEQHVPGIGASGRNAGQWLPGWVGRTPEQVETAYGREAGARLNAFNVSSARLVPALMQRWGMEAGQRHCGVLQVARGRRALQRLETLARQWQRHGSDIAILDRNALREYMATDVYHGGILFRDAGCLNPLAYTRALATAAAASGVQMFCQSPARTLQPDGPGWVAGTGNGRVRARRVIIATDTCSSPGLWPGLEYSYYRLPVPMLCSPVLEYGGRDFLPHGTPFAELRTGGLLFGGMLDAHGRWVVSAAPSLRRGGRERIGAWSLNRFRRVFPHAAPFEWEHLWWGTIGISRDTLPRIYRLAPGVHAVNGYSGGGIALATGIGKALAETLAGGDERALPFAPRPLERVPLRRLLPALLQAAMPAAMVVDAVCD